MAEMFSAVKWGDVSVLGLAIGVIAYLYKKNCDLKAANESEMVAGIKNSIDNLSKTIKESTDKFDRTIENMWTHIGRTDSKLNTLLGQHEARVGEGLSCSCKHD